MVLGNELPIRVHVQSVMIHLKLQQFFELDLLRASGHYYQVFTSSLATAFLRERQKEGETKEKIERKGERRREKERQGETRREKQRGGERKKEKERGGEREKETGRERQRGREGGESRRKSITNL
jgi:hypothetical protein